LTIDLKYLDPGTLATAFGEVLLGIAGAVLVIRKGASRLLQPLRSLHTGSVNDYATFQAAGLVVAATVLLW
jgi:multicomponent Na+:H+ antiporter subunit D